MGLNRHNPIFGYPSPAEVKIYIGETNWVDDAYRIDYTISNPKTPLYDYTSKFYKDVAEGHSIVQGQLVINFRFPGYLRYAVADKLKIDPGKLRTLETAADLFEDMSKGSAADKIRKLLVYKKAGALTNAKQMSNLMHGGDINAPGSNRLMNITQDQPTSRDGFNILIKYGGEEALYTKIIRNCHLVGEGQVISAAAIAGGDMSSSGMPILEIYSFFAKDIVDRTEHKAMTLTQTIKHYGNVSRSHPAEGIGLRTLDDIKQSDYVLNNL
jgi:hypothetical protein